MIMKEQPVVRMVCRLCLFSSVDIATHNIADVVCWLLVGRQGDHMSGKPGNIREFDSCQGNVGDFTKSQGSVSEKNLSGKTGIKLFIVSCIFASILDFAEFVHFILVSDRALFHSYPHH